MSEQEKLNESEKTHDDQTIVLSARDSRAVMEALLHPPAAGSWLRRAAARLRAFTGLRID